MQLLVCSSVVSVTFTAHKQHQNKHQQTFVNQRVVKNKSLSQKTINQWFRIMKCYQTQIHTLKCHFISKPHLNAFVKAHRTGNRVYTRLHGGKVSSWTGDWFIKRASKHPHQDTLKLTKAASKLLYCLHCVSDGWNMLLYQRFSHDCYFLYFGYC